MLAMEKMLSDMPETLYDEHLFSHLIDEALAFDLELRTGYGYPSSQPGLLHVLTQEDPFNKWIQVEKKCTTALTGFPDSLKIRENFENAFPFF